MDEQSHEQLRRDEEEARGLARHLWDAAMPDLTGEIRSSGGSGLQLPVDGRSLTELIHRRGVNCRYLGRLADLAREEEVRDALASPDGGDGTLAGKGRAPRFRMPLCWLELLECEMVARAAKHVLDSYMTGRGGGGSSTASMAAQVPAQTIASFLSAIVSAGEESAAETERRTSGPRGSNSRVVLDQEDINALTLFDRLDISNGNGGNGDATSSPIRGRDEVWSDVEREVRLKLASRCNALRPRHAKSHAIF